MLSILPEGTICRLCSAVVAMIFRKFSANSKILQWPGSGFLLLKTNRVVERTESSYGENEKRVVFCCGGEAA